MFIMSFVWSLYEKYHQCLWCQKSRNQFEKKYFFQKIISASDGKTCQTYLLKVIISVSEDKRCNNFDKKQFCNNFGNNFDEKITSASYNKTPQ